MRLIIALGLVLSLASSGFSCHESEILKNIEEGRAIDQECLNLLAQEVDPQDLSRMMIRFYEAVQEKDLSFESKRAYYLSLSQVVDSLNFSTQDQKADLYHALGVWMFNNSENYDLAAQFYQYEIQLKLDQNPIDSIDVSNVLSNIAYCYFEAGDIEAADKECRSVLEYWPSTPYNLARNHGLMAQIYAAKGNLSLAENYLVLASPFYYNINRDSIDVVDHIIDTKARMYFQFRQYRKANETFKQGLGVIERSGQTGVDIDIRILDFSQNIALTYQRLDSIEAAIRLLAPLPDKYVRLGSTLGAILTNMNIFSILLENGLPTRAFPYYLKSRQLLEESPNPNLLKTLNLNLAHYYRLTSNFDKALRLKQTEVDTCCGVTYQELVNGQYQRISESQVQYLYNQICDIAVIYRDRFRQKGQSQDIDTVKSLYECAASLLEEFKMNQLDPDFSLDIGALNVDLLEEVLQLTYDSIIDSDWYYSFFESAKSTSLLASIQQVRATAFFEQEYPSIGRLRVLREAIFEIEMQLTQNQISDSIRIVLNNQLLRKREELLGASSTLQKQLESNRHIGNLYSHVSLIDLQASLDKKSTLLSYHLTDKDVFILFIDSKDVRLIRRELYDSFRYDLDRIIPSIGEGFQFDVSWIQSANRLSRVLIGGLPEICREQMIIIPDSRLTYLPFEILLTQQATTGSFYSLPYLIKEKTISYNFSASIWSEMVENESVGEGVLTMAPEFHLESNQEGLSMMPLAHAKNEVDAIRQIWKGTKQFQPKNKSEFVRSAGRASIVHFAGHALLNDQFPEYSYLSFSSKDTAYQKLFIREIYNIYTPGEMVVLSACNTGQGQIRSGEGVMSLARAFAYAGSKSLVYSLWDVNDASTKRIVEDFYKELRSGQLKDQAMRTAKLNYLEWSEGNHQHPFFWAGLVVMGDMSPIPESSFSVLKYTILIVGVLGLLFFVFKRRKSARLS